MKKIAEILLWTIGGSFLAIFLSGIDGPWIRIAAWILLVSAVILFISPKKELSNNDIIRPSRWRLAGVMFIALGLIGFEGEKRSLAIDAELQALLLEDENAYLIRVKELRGETSWKDELLRLRPKEHAELIRQEEREYAEKVEAREKAFEEELICKSVSYWLEDIGTSQYREYSTNPDAVYPIQAYYKYCEVSFTNNGFAEVNLNKITVALKDKANIENLEADAVVRLKDKAICRIAWGPFDWKETSADC